MIVNELEKLKNSVVIDIDNFRNEHLNDKEFIKYVIDFSERGGAKGFLSKSLSNLNILKKCTSLPIFAEIEENFNDILISKTYDDFEKIVNLKPNFIVIDMSIFEDKFKDLQKLVKELRFNFDGELVARISTKEQAFEAYRLGIDALMIEIFGDCFDESIVFEICSDINIPTIASLNSVDFVQGKKLVENGVNIFVLGEDVTNPNFIIKHFKKNRNYILI